MLSGCCLATGSTQGAVYRLGYLGCCLQTGSTQGAVYRVGVRRVLSKVWDYLVPVYRQGVPGVLSQGAVYRQVVLRVLFTNRVLRVLSYCLQTDYMMCCLQTRITETAIPIMALPEVLSSGRLYLGCCLRLGLLRVLATCCNLPHLHRVSLKGQISL